MQANGRAQISAPECGTITGAEGGLAQLRSDQADGQGDAASVVFGTGDTVLNAVVSATTATSSTVVTVAERVGITTGQTLILGYGTDNEEEVLTHASAVTEGVGAGDIELADGQVIRNKHELSERVVVKGSATGGMAAGAIRPGSIVIKLNGGATASAWTDNADGTLTEAAGGSGTVDYSSGHMTLTFNAAPGDAGVITYNADTIADLPDQADRTGSGFQKNFFTHSATRQSIPDVMSISNLGATAVGYFVEVSRNGGRTFTTTGWAGAGNRAGTIANGLGRKVVEAPGGAGALIDAVRIRAGQNSGQTSDADTVDEKRQIWDGVLEISHQAMINHNGGSN